MKNTALLSALALVSANLTGCAAVRGIFKAGAWTGAILVFIIVGMIAGAMMLFRNRT